MRRSRFWFWWYHNTCWTGWQNFFLPRLGGDEYGRRTLKWPIHPFGWVIIAGRYCYCDDCMAIRAQTFMFEREEARLRREAAEEE